MLKKLGKKIVAHYEKQASCDCSEIDSNSKSTCCPAPKAHEEKSSCCGSNDKPTKCC